MQKHPLKIVNFYYGFQCNLSCHGCSSGSDMIKHRDHDPSLDEIFDTIENLATYVSDITMMATLLGGEPFLYWDEKIVPMLYKIRKHWPNATLNLTTNGLLLHKYTDEIIEVFSDLKNVKLQISKHASNVGNHPFAKTYEANLNKFLSDSRFHKIHDLHYDLPGFDGPIFDIHLEQWDQPFVAQFQFKDGKVKPFAANDPEGSMANGCIGSFCSMVINNRLYKCPRLAALPIILKEKNQLGDPDWQKYLHTYVDLKLASQEDIDRFYQEEGKPIAQCDVCPNQRIPNETLIPRTARTILPIKLLS